MEPHQLISIADPEIHSVNLRFPGEARLYTYLTRDHAEPGEHFIVEVPDQYRKRDGQFKVAVVVGWSEVADLSSDDYAWKFTVQKVDNNAYLSDQQWFVDSVAEVKKAHIKRDNEQRRNDALNELDELGLSKFTSRHRLTRALSNMRTEISEECEADSSLREQLLDRAVGEAAISKSKQSLRDDPQVFAQRVVTNVREATEKERLTAQIHERAVHAAKVTNQCQTLILTRADLLPSHAGTDIEELSISMFEVLDSALAAYRSVRFSQPSESKPTVTQVRLFKYDGKWLEQPVIFLSESLDIDGYVKEHEGSDCQSASGVLAIRYIVLTTSDIKKISSTGSAPEIDDFRVMVSATNYNIAVYIDEYGMLQIVSCDDFSRYTGGNMVCWFRKGERFPSFNHWHGAVTNRSYGSEESGSSVRFRLVKVVANE